MDVVIYTVLSAISGVIFSITLIPLMPAIFIRELCYSWKNEPKSIFWIFLVSNFLFPLLPILFIAGAFRNGFLPGVAFTAGMYWIAIDGFLKKQEKQGG
jgi:hypothetical protein